MLTCMLLRRIEAALLPSRCVFCGTATRDGALCRDCHDDLPWLGPSCPRCARPLGLALPRGACCEACRVRGPPLQTVLAPMAYAFPIDAAIKALKFRRQLHYGPVFVDLLMTLRAELPADIDAVLAVPLHWRRRWLRGFNQAEELARPVARRLDVPIIGNVHRRRAMAFQSGLSARERARNLRAAFAVRGRLDFRHVLIVDDVITSGATLRQLAMALQRAGVRKVSGLAIARAG